MPGLVPGIHALKPHKKEDVDGRDERGHDAERHHAMTPSPFDLTGRVAIVTGGNGGIGLGMARGLAEAGAAVAIVGGNAAKSEAGGAELKQRGAKAISIIADVTGKAAVDQM